MHMYSVPEAGCIGFGIKVLELQSGPVEGAAPEERVMMERVWAHKGLDPSESEIDHG